MCSGSGCGASNDPPPVDERVEAVAGPSTLVASNGGPIIPHPNLVVVNWNGGVDPVVGNAITGFYSTLLGSSYVSGTIEYGVGAGGAFGIVPIVPAPAHAGLVVTKSDVAAELDAHITAHDLPAPDGNTVYAVYLPPGYTADLDGARSCQTICGFHERCTPPTCSRTIHYEVIPDQGACSLCSHGLAKLDATTVISTHELIEAATDPELNAWAFRSLSAVEEVTDLCENVNPPRNAFLVQTARVGSFLVEKSWSNVQHNCTAGTNTTPAIGHLDTIDVHGVAFGWACDPDTPGTALTVNLFTNTGDFALAETDGTMLSGGTLVAQTTANQPSEPAVGDLCHGGSVHRFSVSIPTNVPGQRIWAGAIDTSNGSTYDLGHVDLPPSQIALPVPPGDTYYFSDPTPSSVARDEDILIRNLGPGDLVIANPASLVSGSCFQQIGTGPAVIAGNSSAALHVRLLCPYATIASGTVSIQHNSPGIANPYTVPLFGQVAPGAVFDVRLTATYLPEANTTRQAFETRQAHPATSINFYYVPTPANFEQRPGGACQNGYDNPAYFKLSLHGNVSISTCRFQASWDPSELPCPQAAIDAFNTPGREIVINTDEFVTDPTTCQVAPGLPQVHLHNATSAFMRILFDVGGATYVRRVDFIKHS